MAKMKECPVCGVHVKLENLEAHIRKVHPKVNAKAYLSEDDKTVIKVAKKKERKAAQPFEEQERRRWLIAGFIILIIVVPLIFVLSTASPPGAGCDIVNKDAIPINVGDVEGKVYNLYERFPTKQLIVLEFFQTSCSYCQMMAYDLAELHEHYDWGETVEFVSISSSSADSVQAVRDFRDSYSGGTNMTYIYDSSHALSGEYCVSATPTTVFIDSSGKVIKWSQGAKSYDQMKTIIDDILQG